MTRRRVTAVAGLLGILALSACGGGELKVPGRDACNAVLSWISEGTPAERTADVISRVESLIADAEEPSLEESLAALRAASADDAADAAHGFLEACVARGWELPEG